MRMMERSATENAIDWDHVPQRAGRSETVALPRGHLPKGHPGIGTPAMSYSKYSAQSIGPQTARALRSRRHHRTAYQAPETIYKRRGSMDNGSMPSQIPTLKEKHSRFGSVTNLFFS